MVTTVVSQSLSDVYVCRVTMITLISVLQTKSEAAAELEKFRKDSEREKSVDPPSSPPSLSRTSLPDFTPPPPPPLPQTPLTGPPPPPPPPPLLPQGRPSTVAQSSVNAPMNPALAREAMLEAIRSGAAADRLKKVKYSIGLHHILKHALLTLL